MVYAVQGRTGAPRDKLVTGALTAEVWEKFMAFCKSNEISQSRMVRELVEEWLERQDSFLGRNGEEIKRR